MMTIVELPLWLLVLILLFAAVTFASHFLFPSVRWFLRRRAERVVAELNKRLERPIQPFKLARRTDMIQRLIYHPDVMRAVAERAAETGDREDVVFEEAKRYAREIVPAFSAWAYFSFATRAARWLSKRLYEVEVRYQDAEAIRKIDPDATVVYVMNHRSNMDYVLVTYLVANQSALSYAVGEWARFWPLRPLIRALGGYFIRRRSRNALYRRVLARYVRMATENGVMQAVFPEGGLSQTGRIGPPKVGILSYITDDYDPEGRDVVFVPVALNYDRVIEDTLLIEAGRTGVRRYRGTIPSAMMFTLRYVWRRLQRKAKRFGSAGVSFGDPVSLRKAPALREPEALAQALMRRIGAATPVLPVPLVASMLHGETGGITRDDLTSRVADRMADLNRSGAALALPEADAAAAVDAALAQLEMRQIVESGPDGLRVVPEKAGLIEFYAATLGDITRPEPESEAAE